MKLRRCNQIALPIIMALTLVFFVFAFVSTVKVSFSYEQVGLLLQTLFIILVALIAYFKKYYAAANVVLLFKLMFAEGQAIIKVLLTNYQADFTTYIPYFEFFILGMFFFLPALLITTLVKEKQVLSLTPYMKYINAITMFIFLTLFVGPEVALFAVIPAFVLLSYDMKLEPDVLFLSAVIFIPFQMVDYMLDKTREITLYYGLYWTIGIILVVYGFFITINEAVQMIERSKKNSKG